MKRKERDYDPVREAERMESLRERVLANPMDTKRCDLCGIVTPDWHDYHHVNCHRRIPGSIDVKSGSCDCDLIACDRCCPDCKEAP